MLTLHTNKYVKVNYSGPTAHKATETVEVELGSIMFSVTQLLCLQTTFSMPVTWPHQV